MTKPKSSRTCKDCGATGDLDKFVTGRNLCLNCQAERQKRSRSKKRESITITDKKRAPNQEHSIFDNRESLTVGLRSEFESALTEAKDMVEFNKNRLEAAKLSGDPESIEEASKALQRAANAHVSLISRLSEKLQGLDELAAKAEKAKPVSFFLLQPGKFPNLAVMREIPQEYYPTKEQASNEVEFD